MDSSGPDVGATRELKGCTNDGTLVDWESAYTIPVRGGGKVLEILTAPLI